MVRGLGWQAPRLRCAAIAAGCWQCGQAEAGIVTGFHCANFVTFLISLVRVASAAQHPNWAERALVVNGEGSGPGPDAVFWVWQEAGHVLRGRGNTGTDAMGNAVHAISRRLPLWSRRVWGHEVHAAPGSWV